MGTCLVFLLYYITPIISADNIELDFHDIYFAVLETIREFSQKKDLEKSINCELKPKLKPEAKFNLTEVRCGLVWMNEIPRRLKFWNELVPELMQWLSAEVIDCGIYSSNNSERHEIYERRHEIYRIFKHHRSDWINALQDLVYCLLNVHNHTIYVSKQNKTVNKKAYEWFQALTENGGLHWEQNWLEAYESWYTAHEYRDMFQEYPSPLKYLQTIIVNSFETVIQWLVNHMGYKGVTTYLPKSPRRPIILIWPSVMQPALAEAVNKKARYDYGQAEEYMKITCDKQTHEWITPITINEVRNAIHEFDETPRAPNFFGILVPELITWVSTEVIYCGFITVFPKERHQIYRFIGQNRSKWIRAVQELVYILLQVIAVIHFKRGVFETLLPSSFQSIFDKSHMDWIENWDETYEIWYEKYVNHTIFAKKQQPKTQLRYLQTFVLNSLDIVTAWLFDYMGERTRNTIAAKPFSKPLWKHADFSEWTLSNDPNITCALENYDLNWFRVPTPRWDYMLDNADDKMKLMAEYFMTCEVISGCVYEGYTEVIIGRKGSDWIVRTPYPEDCKHNCSDVPAAYKAYVYAYAHMTTVAGHSLHCEYNSTSIYKNEVTLECYPLHVDNYLSHRQNVICKSKSCKAPCCKPLALRTPKEPQPHCEIVTYAMSQPGFEIQARINLPFYDIEEK